MKLTLKEFVGQLAYWYKKYTESPHFTQYRNLEAGLSQKASDLGYLEKGDLLWIAIWGSDEKRHQLGTLIYNNNTSESVVAHTRQAVQSLSSPKDALESLMLIKYVGPAYGSKTLRCIYPQEYGAFDIHVRKACACFLPTMEDRETEITGYLRFLDICRSLRNQVTVPGPRPRGLWYVADVEMVIFQFAYEGGAFKAD